MRLMTSFRTGGVTLLLMGLILAACGGTPTSTDVETVGDTAQLAAGSEQPTANASDCSERLQQIYAEVEGLEWDARREYLLERAEQESGALGVYASTGA